MKDFGHKLSVEIYEGRLAFGIECRYDSLDQKRPCWPATESGELEPSPQYVCTYKTWVENLMPEEFHIGSVEINDWPFEWIWNAWDEPQIRLLPLSRYDFSD